MKIVVQKFGGTSVSTPSTREHAAAHVQLARKQGYQVVVVVSAMGRKGDPYATDQLLNLIQKPELCSGRDLDLLLSCGETISAVVFANLLQAQGMEATVLTGAQAGIVTDSSYGEARVLEVQTDRLHEELKAGRVPVVTGFQGATQGGDVTTLGRGGSDTTAAALGAALKAHKVEIFTDVDGFLTADPRLVTNAHLLSELSYSDASHLACEGAKVIHPRAVEIAMRHGIPMHVRATTGTQEGSRITNGTQALEDHSYSSTHILGVAYRSSLVHYTIEADSECQQEFFATIHAAGVPAEVTTTFPQGLSLTLGQQFTEQLKSYVKEHQLEIVAEIPCARISLVGNLSDSYELSSQVFHSLADHSIEILQVAESPFSLRVIVPASDLPEAITLLHNYVSTPACSSGEKQHPTTSVSREDPATPQTSAAPKQDSQQDTASLKVLV